MAGVFREALSDVQSETWGKGLLPRGVFLLRESAGVLHGAIEARLRAIAASHSWLSIPSRRFIMPSEFRFPKAAPVLMAVILAGVILTIEKATAIQDSLPYSNPQLPPIQAGHFTFFPAMAVIFLAAYAVAVIAWAVFFALRRSRVHRLSEMPAAPPQN
jgi:hypothetical protein